MTHPDISMAALRDLDDGTLAGNASVFGILEGQAQGVPVDRIDEAAYRVQVAAHFAWMNHPGRFGSDVLEETARAAASRCGVAGPRATGARRGVVHVLTQALAVGGHTRLVTRWIRADPRPPTVVLAAQGWHAPPASLVDAVVGRGGAIIDLGSGVRSLARRSASLRRHLANAELAVLHLHPFDIVPLLALSGWEDRPPVALMNHADHVFWIGRSVADTVVNFRGSGQDLAIARRGLPAARQALLPVPVDATPPVADRAAARAALGLPDAAVAVLTIASAYKLDPYDGDDYLAEMTLLAERIPALHVLVVGPRPTGRWAEVAQRTAGKIRALGIRDDVAGLRAAADIYLDSYPLTSVTSMLEAGASGLPVVRRAASPGMEIFTGDAPGLDETVLAYATSADLAGLLGDLVDDPHERSEAGRRTLEAVRSVCGGASWAAQLEAIYAATHSARTGPVTPAGPAVFRDDPLGRRLARLESSGTGLGAAIAAHVRYAPLSMRPDLLRRVGRAAVVPAATPDWLRARVRRLRRSTVARHLADDVVSRTTRDPRGGDQAAPDA